MSYVRTMTSVAMGLAAAKGLENFRRFGGLAGMQQWVGGTGAGNIGMQVAAMAERMGVPGGAAQLNAFMTRLGAAPATASEAGSAGLGAIMSALQSSAAVGGQMADDMVKAFFGGTPVAMAQEEGARLMLRAMIQAAKADGEVEAAEKAKILEQLTDVPAEERAFVEAELEKPLDPAGLASDTQEAMKAQVYAASLATMRIDSAAGSDYLRRLSEGLGLGKEARDRIHAAMGVPPLAT